MTACCTATTPTTKTLEISNSPLVGSAGFQARRRTGLPGVRRPDRQFGRRGQIHQRRVAHAGAAGVGELLRRGDGAALPAVPRRRRELPLRRRAVVGVLLGELRDHRAPAVHAAAARRCAACRSPSSASTGPATCRNASPPPAFTSPPAAAPARCGTSTRRSPTRARSWCRSRRCPTAATTCGWPAPWSAARPGMVSRVRPSRSGWAASFAMRTGSSTRKDSTCPATDRRHPDRRGMPGLRARQLPAARLPRARPGPRSRRAPQHGVALPGQASVTGLRMVRHPAGRVRDIGPINWIVARLARAPSAPRRCTCSPSWVSAGGCSGRGCRTPVPLLRGTASRASTPSW